MKTIQLVTLGVVIGTCPVSIAKDRPADGPPPNRQDHFRVPPEIIKEFDKDGDGELSHDEAKAAREARQAEMMKKFDKDGDGELSEDERKAMRSEMEARYKAILEKYDANKNGKLDPEEIKTAREAGEKFPWMGPHPGGPRNEGGGKRERPDDGNEGDRRPAPPVE